MSLPRIITVDPTWTIARIVRSAIDLVDTPIIHVDVQTSADALTEVERGCTLVVSAYEIDDEMKGFELAMRIKRSSPDTAVIVLGDVNDPDEMDEESAADSPFVYLSRPLDVQRFLRVLSAGLNGEDMKAALVAPVGVGAGGGSDFGPVPHVDVNTAGEIVDKLLKDLGAIAVLLANRDGEVLVERGAVGYLNREQLAYALTPLMTTGINIKDIVGGDLTTVQLYDGDDYDVFVLSVGLHHFICVVFDGSMGARQFGIVNSLGRRTVGDLIALIGANAFFIAPKPAPAAKPRPAKRTERTEDDDDMVPLERATIEVPAEESEIEEALQLDPIEADADELAALFSDGGGEMGDDLFDLDEMEELASKADQQSNKGKLGWDEAMNIGLLKGN